MKSTASDFNPLYHDWPFIDALPMMIWVLDGHGSRTSPNQAARKFFGIPNSCPTAQDWAQSVHPDDLDACVNTLKSAIAEDQPIEVQYRIRRTTTEYQQIIERGIRLPEINGNPDRYLLISEDVTHQQTALELRTKVACLTAILEASPDYISITNANGGELFLNTAGQELIGIETANDPNKVISERHPEWAREILIEAIPVAIRDGIWKGESSLLQSTGKEIAVCQTILAHPNPQGSIECFSTIIRDLSDRKKHEVNLIEQTNLHAAAIRASGQVLFDWNSTTNEIAYDGDLERMLGYTPSEMAGGLATLRKLIHPEHLRSFDSEIHRVTGTRDPFHLEFLVCHKDASYRAIRAQGHFFLDRTGQIGRMIGFLSDISHQRNAQEALEQTQATLETRVEQRTSELAEAYAIIKDQAIEQETIANLGRQALRGVALSNLIKESSEAVRKVLHADYCSVLQVQPSQDELLATGQSGWPDPDICLEVPLGNRSQSGFTLEIRRPVIVTDMATETRFSPSESVISHGVVSSASVVIGSDDRAFGVLAVFSKNPRDFNPQAIHFLQSIANVLAEAIRREHDDVFIRYAHKKSMVANRTKAEFLSSMSHELRTPLNVIFGFTQLLQLDRPTPSQLESIEHIAKAGKHLLTLIDELLEIAGPKNQEAPAPSGQISQTLDSTALPSVAILYIEDQPLNQRLVERILQPYTQYRLISSTLGADGIESAKKHRPDLILLDLNLPDMRGDEVLHQLKADPTTRHIPVVMVSADAMQGRSDQLRQQGASAYISKPYKVTELLETIIETLTPSPHSLD